MAASSQDDFIEKPADAMPSGITTLSDNEDDVNTINNALKHNNIFSRRFVLFVLSLGPIPVCIASRRSNVAIYLDGNASRSGLNKRHSSHNHAVRSAMLP
jgi:hypothetical protein